MNKIYIVINESFSYTAFGYNIIDCFCKEEDAKTCIKNLSENFIKICDEGDPEGFDEYTVSSDNTSVTIEDNYGDFEKYLYIEKITK